MKRARSIGAVVSLCVGLAGSSGGGRVARLSVRPGLGTRGVGTDTDASVNMTSATDVRVRGDRVNRQGIADREGSGPVFQDVRLTFDRYACPPVDPLRHPHIQSDGASTLER